MGFDEATGEFAPRKIDRGPIFNRNGGLTPDWDPLTRVPIFVMTLNGDYTYPDGSPITTYDVFSKKFLVAIANNLEDVQRRIRSQRKQFARDVERKADDIGGEMTDFIWRQAMKSDATRDNSITKEEAAAAMLKAEKRWKPRRTFEDCFEA